jgi:hypothetical protein
MPSGNIGTPVGGGNEWSATPVGSGLTIAVHFESPALPTPFAVTVSVVVLVVGVLGAVTGTLMVWLIESDAVAGMGFDGTTVPTTQVPDGDPGVTVAATSNWAASEEEAEYVSRKVRVFCPPGVKAVLVLVSVRVHAGHANTGATAPRPARVNSNARTGTMYFALVRLIV